MYMTFGMDVEFLLETPRSKRRVPACGLFGGTKQEPIPVPLTGYEHYLMQEDGPALELNCPPAETVSEFVLHAKNLRHIAHTLAAERKLRIITDWDWAYFGPVEYWKGSKYRGMRTIGCDPDYDAFSSSLEPRRIPELSEFEGFRFAGGHIHIGYNTEWYSARSMAASLAGALAPFHNPDSARYKWYGIPGIYRPKSYGVEYRSLGNTFVLDDAVLTRLAVALDEWRLRFEREARYAYIDNNYMGVAA